MSESAVIPKESLTAFERWELSSLGSGTPPRRAGNAGAPRMPTAGDVESVLKTARDEGYAAGYQEGRAAATQEAQRLAAAMGALEAELVRVDDQVAQELLQLALAVARQVIRTELEVKPELVLPAVREAIENLPVHSSHPRLLLHPDDARLVRSQLGEQLEHTGWKIHEDLAIQRGGCRVESAGTQVDATLDTRWQRVMAAIGENAAWRS